MSRIRPSSRGFTNEFLQKIDSFDRYVIGYSYNPGGYQPWAKVSREYYLLTVKRMEKRGWITVAERQGKKFMKLTKRGKLQALFYKFKDIEKKNKDKWDGKWRLAIFDIPEKGRCERDQIRKFLKIIGFHGLQKSVYIYPYALPPEAVAYLKESGLDLFIRFLRVDQMDNDKGLRGLFKLPKIKKTK